MTRLDVSVPGGILSCGVSSQGAVLWEIEGGPHACRLSREWLDSPDDIEAELVDAGVQAGDAARAAQAIMAEIGLWPYPNGICNPALTGDRRR